MDSTSRQIGIGGLSLLALLVLAFIPIQAQSLPPYIDNRSAPDTLIISYFSAINRQEYVRAYSYWEDSATISGELQPFDQFEQGYANTQSVQLIIGIIGSDAGAGQLYFAVPVTLIVQTTASTAQTFAGCYTLHLAQPAIQAEPPFRPLAISSAQVQQVANTANTAALMAQACANQNIPPNPSGTVTPIVDPSLIDQSRYLDDRTDAVQVLRSLFNAINRHEYARAYSYWNTAAITEGKVAEFSKFQKGYDQTQSVQLITGTVNSDAGAGQIYYSVPVTLIAITTTRQQQTFVGCYLLYISEPSFQGAPPFQPLGINEANIRQVANTANTADLMQQSCVNIG